MCTCLVWDNIFNKWTKYEDNWSTRTADIHVYWLCNCLPESIGEFQLCIFLTPIAKNHSNRRHLLNLKLIGSCQIGLKILQKKGEICSLIRQNLIAETDILSF